jgi:DNA-binding NtrC family response regulator
MGNVRELRNVLERACMLADGAVLTGRDLHAAAPPEGKAREEAPDPAPAPAAALSDDLHCVEREHIIRVLAETRGNKRAAAERLGLSRRTLYRRLQRYQLMEALGAQER